jgi:hypothetical protein
MTMVRNGATTGLQTRALVAGSITLSLALGARATFGLFLIPLDGLGISVANVALAIGVHNLAWGAAQPVAGAIADRRGATWPQAFGGRWFMPPVSPCRHCGRPPGRSCSASAC